MEALKAILAVAAVAAAALVAATAFSAAARLWWVFDLFTHFRLQYTVAAVILAVAALAAGSWRTAVVLAVVAVVHGWTIKDLWLGGVSPAASTAATTIRVASVNVQVDNPTPEKVVPFVRAADPDLLMLVEATGSRWRPVLAEIAKLYPYQAPADRHAGAPVLLFSRHPVREAGVIEPDAGRRPYLRAKIVVADRVLTVVGVHPTSPSPKDASDSRVRNLQLDHIARSSRDADRPVIVMGDFNTSPWSPHFRDLLAAADLRNAAEGHGWIATWPAWLWPARVPIDHVLLSGPLGVASIRRGPSTGSDHYPLIADLRLLAGN